MNLEKLRELAAKAPANWAKPIYENDVGPNDDYYVDWFGVEGAAKFDREEDANFARAAVNLVRALVSPEGMERMAKVLCYDLMDDDWEEGEKLYLRTVEKLLNVLLETPDEN